MVRTTFFEKCKRYSDSVILQQEVASIALTLLVDCRNGTQPVKTLLLQFTEDPRGNDPNMCRRWKTGQLNKRGFVVHRKASEELT